MMQEDATYMNLFVVEQFYKIFKFHFIQDGSFNLIPHITFHLFTSSIFSNLGTIFISSNIQKRFFLCSINLRSIPIDLYNLGLSLTCQTNLETYRVAHFWNRSTKIFVKWILVLDISSLFRHWKQNDLVIMKHRIKFLRM